MALTTDAAPSIHFTPLQVLQDKGRLKRLRASLCSGIFSYADADAADKIVTECLKICGGSEETLSTVLQSRILFDYTPFRWVIANRPAHDPTSPNLDSDLDHEKDRDTVPPLFLRLLMVCDQGQMELYKEVQEEIMEVLGQYYHSDVYAAVKDKLTRVPTYHPGNPETFFRAKEDRIVVAAQQSWSYLSSATFNFKIPKFFDRLSVDEQVWFEFLALGKNTVRLTVAVKKDPSLGNRLRPYFGIQMTWHAAWRISCYVRLMLKNSQNSPDYDEHFAVGKDFTLGPNTIETEGVLKMEKTIEELHCYINPKSVGSRALCGTITLSTRNL